ncbi:MAG: glycosyltransferase family 2 protein [Burkholderiales bacterium]|nr:MAG: glycosyltransferase family 2 protein [Burkholderiales bacterium]
MSIVFILAVLPWLLPAFSLLALTLASLRRPEAALTDRNDSAPAARIAALVPAHNESTHLLPTIACLRSQLGPDDRLLVVADNCDDDTADIARRAGAEVVERRNPGLRGKGYALAFGVDHLRADPPDVVLIVDADCQLSEGAVAAIGSECRRTGKPVQMLDRVHASAGTGARIRVLEFANVMKNLVRPLGTSRLGGTCLLNGTGMALPWALVSTAELATGHVAEDMKLGIELAKSGHAPLFLPQVMVSSVFVRDSGVARVEKSRWEHGSLATLVAELPSLLGAGLVRRNLGLIALAMDLMIPPLALYCVVLAAVLAGSLAGAWITPAMHAAAATAVLGALSFAVAVAIAWLRHGRQLLSARELLGLPLYVLWKLPVYAAYLIGARAAWVRTKREASVHSH